MGIGAPSPRVLPSDLNVACIVTTTRDAEEHVHRDGHRANREVQEWKKDSKDQEERTSKIMGSKSCPSGPLRDL